MPLIVAKWKYQTAEELEAFGQGEEAPEVLNSSDGFDSLISGTECTVLVMARGRCFCINQVNKVRLIESYLCGINQNKLYVWYFNCLGKIFLREPTRWLKAIISIHRLIRTPNKDYVIVPWSHLLRGSASEFSNVYLIYGGFWHRSLWVNAHSKLQSTKNVWPMDQVQYIHWEYRGQNPPLCINWFVEGYEADDLQVNAQYAFRLKKFVFFQKLAEKPIISSLHT